MFKKYVAVFLMLVAFAVPVLAVTDESTTALSTEAIIAKIKAVQALIKDMQADTKTTVTSNLSMPGQAQKGPQTMVQTGHIWTKGQNMSKVEITTPMRQITITNGDIMTIISPDTGRKMTQDMSKMPGFQRQGADVTKVLDYFGLTVTTQQGQTGEADTYIISGTPKGTNQFLGRMDFFIDASRYVPVRIAMYNPKGALMSLTEMEYTGIEVSTGESIWVPSKIKSTVTSQMGNMNTEMVYENIKVNEGIKDSVFEE